MDEDFIFQVTEEELAQFPEEEGIEKEWKEGSKSPIEPVQKKEGEENTLQKKKVKIPSLLDLNYPGCMLPAEMASVADRTRNRTSEVRQEGEDNADNTVVAGRTRGRCGQYSIHRIRRSPR